VAQALNGLLIAYKKNPSASLEEFSDYLEGVTDAPGTMLYHGASI
jgi:hypothetical protein